MSEAVQPKSLEQKFAEVANALDRLLCATAHYGIEDQRSEEYWESYAESAAENGQTSNDIRTGEWMRARSTFNALCRDGEARA